MFEELNVDNHLISLLMFFSMKRKIRNSCFSYPMPICDYRSFSIHVCCPVVRKAITNVHCEQAGCFKLTSRQSLNIELAKKTKYPLLNRK